MPVAMVFNPFWRSIGYTAVKDLQNRPQVIQSVTDLLGISVPDLFRMAQTEILPWLVLNNNKEVILKLTQACKYENPFKACMADSNLPGILALLLVQNVPKLEDFAMALLRDVSPDFNGMELDELLRMVPLGTSLRLLRISVEENDPNSSRVG